MADELLPNETLEPGFPTKITVETARKWMLELGSMLKKKKGTFINGHQRDDVVEYRKTFFRQMVALGFLNEACAPTDNAKKTLLSAPPQELTDKTVVIIHDESTFQANQDQPTLWAEKGTNVMRPKSKRSGITVSDFIDKKMDTCI